MLKNGLILNTNSQLLQPDDGKIVFYDLVKNEHQSGILFKSEVEPDHPLSDKARNIATQILEKFNYVGTLAIEFFVVAGDLMVNEMAPRVHNTGHFSIEGTECSQFENHIRAVSNQTIKQPKTIDFPAMINLISKINLTQKNLPKEAILHQYGKEPREGRKLGHITLVAINRNKRNQLVSQIISQMN